MTEQEKKDYNEFLEQKKTQRIESGFKVEDADLNPALFDFQKYCVKRALAVGKFALFEDCGLGKTIQIISVVLKLKEEGKLSKPVLVICPTTLMGNWMKELQMFAPSLKVSIY